MHSGKVHNTGGQGCNGVAPAVIEIFDKDSRGHHDVRVYWPRMPRIRTFIHIHPDHLAAFYNNNFTRGELVRFDYSCAPNHLNGAVHEIRYATNIERESRFQWEHIFFGYTPKILSSLFVGSIILGILNYAIGQNLLPMLGIESFTYKTSNLWAILGGDLFYALLLLMLIGYWAGDRSLQGGFKAGAVLGVILGLQNSLTELSNGSEHCCCILLLLILIYSLKFAVAGSIIGAIFGSRRGNYCCAVDPVTDSEGGHDQDHIE